MAKFEEDKRSTEVCGGPNPVSEAARSCGNAVAAQVLPPSAARIPIMSNNAFTFVLIFAVVTSALRAEQGPMEIVEDRQRQAPADSSQDVGRPFDPVTLCSADEPSTLQSAFGTDVMTLIVHDYDRETWTDFETVQRYVRRILSGQPEGGTLHGSVYWSEYRRVEIWTSVQFRSGQRRRAAFANGYAHVEDEFGCQWWARYLGPDRTKWIVRAP